MNSIRKKAGFLEGLMASMKQDANDPATQLNVGIVSLLSEMAERIEAMDDLIGELNDYVESIDDDLTILENGGERDNYAFGGEDEDDDDFDDDVKRSGGLFGKITNWFNDAFRNPDVGDDDDNY